MDRGLTDHELIKIRIQAEIEKNDKHCSQKCVESLGAMAIQLIGGDWSHLSKVTNNIVKGFLMGNVIL